MNKYLLKIAEVLEGEGSKGHSPLHNTITAVAANAPADIAGGWAGSIAGRKLAGTSGGQNLAKRFGKYVHLTGGEVGGIVGGLTAGAAATYAAFKSRDRN